MAILAFAASTKDDRVSGGSTSVLITDVPLACSLAGPRGCRACSPVGFVALAARRADFRGGTDEDSDCWCLRAAISDLVVLWGKKKVLVDVLS